MDYSLKYKNFLAQTSFFSSLTYFILQKQLPMLELTPLPSQAAMLMTKHKNDKPWAPLSPQQLPYGSSLVNS